MSFKKNICNQISLEDLAKMVKMQSPDQFWEDLSINFNLSEAENNFLSEGKSQEEAESLVLEMERDCLDKEYGNYVNELVSKSEILLQKYDLIISQEKGKYFISPRISWRNAASQVLELINGIGMFHFSSLSEFLGSGPYSPKESVMNHIHHLSSHNEVYGA